MIITRVRIEDFGVIVSFAGFKTVSIYNQGNEVVFENIARNRAQDYLNQAWAIPEIKQYINNK